MAETIHKAYGLEKDYFILRNKDVQRDDLSYEARGMLAYLISLPADWEIRVTNLEIESAGREKVRRILKELIEAGYLALVKNHDEKGHFIGSHYEAFAIPEQNHHRETGLPTVGLTESRANQQQQSKQKEEKGNTSSSPKKSDADILATLFNVIPQTPKDWKFWGNIVKDLKAAGILSSEYTVYLSWIKKQSAAQGNWTVTPTSLTNASRPSLYISEKENKAQKPARASLSFEHMQDTRPEEQVIREARAAMERGES